MSEQIDFHLKSIIEGLIFAADEPLTYTQIKELVESDEAELKVSPTQVRSIVEDLNRSYEDERRPFQILSLAGGYQYATKRDVAVFVGKLHKEQAKRRLTQTALETLAIIAYKQPITKSDLESIRGVNSDYILKSLLEKDLITVTGREHAPGRPLLYGTTKRFLHHFGLNSLSDLPKPREIEELIGETELEVEKRMLELERLRQEHEEDLQQKRDRKPHPISDGAMAKIIPLNPDYRPPRLPKETVDVDSVERPVAGDTDSGRQEPAAKISDGERRSPLSDEREERAENAERTPAESVDDEGADTASDEVRMKESVDISPEEPLVPDTADDAPGESGDMEEIGMKEKDESTGIEYPITGERTSAEADLSAAKSAAEEGTREAPATGWKKWKNKIVVLIKKIFG